MASAEDEKNFLRAAVDAIPKIAEIVCKFSPEDQAGALEVAEWRFMQAARDYGCTEISARSRASAIMRLLRRQVKARQTSEVKLRALLQKLTEPLFRNLVRALELPCAEWSKTNSVKNHCFVLSVTNGAFVMLFVCFDPDFSIASTVAAVSISHRTYFDERNVRQAGQATI